MMVYAKLIEISGWEALMKDGMYMIAGEDENGDVHMIATDNLERARAAYEKVKTQFGEVITNCDFMSAATKR
jgi:hypothetical protein